MHIVSGRLVCTSLAEAAIVAEHLLRHIALSRAEPGCRRFEIRATRDPLVWTIDEAFVNAQSFAAHTARTRGSDWWRETSAMRREIDDHA